MAGGVVVRAVLASATAAAALVLTGCGGSEVDDLEARVSDLEASLSATPASAAPTTPPLAAAATPTPPASAVPSPSETVVTFTMPDLTGSNLQVAQNAVQELGVFYSVSHDLLGIRNQVLDGNWQVCDQQPPPGTTVSAPASQLEGAIDFGVVKLSERCP